MHVRFVIASVSVAAVACGRSKAPSSAMSDELKRDILAATTVPATVNVSADELGPQAKPAPASRLKKAAGPRVVASTRSTVKASREPVEAAELPSPTIETETVAAAPVPAETEAPSAPPSARPAPIPMPAYPGAGQGSQRGSGSGAGGVLGGIFGGIFGGGGAGDDHCDPRTDGRARGRYPTGGQRGPVYMPRGGIGNPVSPGTTGISGRRPGF